AGREEPSPYRHDDHGALRVVAYPLTFAHVLDNAFDQIRQSGINQVAVAMRLFEKIAILGAVVTGERNRAALLRQAEMVRRGYQREVHEEIDLAALEERYTRA